MRSVLIFDDERIEREGIAALLQMGNYNLEILEAVNGKETLTILKEKNCCDNIIYKTIRGFL